jgi:hypothetical protein
MLVREATVPAGEHAFHLQQIPQALDNTFWYDSPDDAEISDLKTSLQLIPFEVAGNASTIAQYLRLNVGRHVEFKQKLEGNVERLSGTEVALQDSASPTVTVLLADQTIREVNATTIVSLSTKGLVSKGHQHGVRATLRVDLRTRATRPSRIRFYSLEFGAAWTASYKVDLGDSDATVSAKAQVALGGLEFEDTKTQLVTGMPNLNRATKLDMTTGSASLTDWLNGNGAKDLGISPPETDPYERIAKMMVLAQENGYSYDPQTGLFRQRGGLNFGGFGGGGSQGGFGGGGRGLTGGQGLVPDGIDFISYNPSDNSLIKGSEMQQRLTFVNQAIAAQRLEDLFTFPLDQVSLKPGEKLSRVLSRTASEATTHYIWDVDEFPGSSQGAKIRRVLTLSNKSKGAWPTGAVLVTRENIPLAETEMPFTAIGKAADLELGTAEDLPKTQTIKETSREAQLMPDGSTNQLVTYEIELSVENTRNAIIPLDLRLNVLGDITQADGAILSPTNLVQSALNPSSEAVWHLKLEPGEKKTLKATYKRLI